MRTARARRLILLPLLATLTLLEGCSPLSQSVLSTLRQGFLTPSLKVDESTLDPASAYMRASVGRSQLVVGRGGYSDQGDEVWYTASSQILVLRDGLLDRTAGMPVDLLGSRLVEPHPLSRGLAELTLPATVMREVRRPGRAPELSEYRLHSCGPTRVRTWGRDWQVLCLRETLVRSDSSDPLPGSSFWVDRDSGQWVQSLQYIDGEWPVLLQPRPGNPPVVDSGVPLVRLPAGQSRHVLVAVEPMRLSQLLLRYPLPEAWRPATAWLSNEAEAGQRQLKRGVLFDIEQALKVSADQSSSSLQEERRRLMVLADTLRAMPVTGRKLLPVVEPRWLQSNPRLDPVLNGGDRLVRLTGGPQVVEVIGNVAHPCSVNAVGDATVTMVLRRCLPGAWPDAVQVISPDGQTHGVEVALWNRADEPVPAGSRILVPFPMLDKFSGNSQSARDLAGWLATQPGFAGMSGEQP